jgi:hypothetical protein
MSFYRLCAFAVLLGVLAPSLYAAEAETAQRVAVRSWSEIAATPAPDVNGGLQVASPRPPTPGPTFISRSSSSQASQARLEVQTGSLLPAPAFPGLSIPTPPPVLDFDALLDDGRVIPPDTHGSVGPNHVVTMLNSQVKIQNKTGGQISVVTLNQFWSAIPGGKFDPRIHFDATSGRWLASCDATPDSLNNRLCFALSASDDPTGVWTFYSFNGNNGGTDSTWADFPTLGFNTTWVAITANMFKVKAGTFQGSKMWVINKSSVLSGGAIQFSTFQTGWDATLGGGVRGASIMPCLTYGGTDTLYLVDVSGYIDSGDTTALVRISRIRGTATSPIWEAVPGSFYGGATGLFRANNNFGFVSLPATQLGSPIGLDVVAPRVMNAVFRNGAIWCAHSASLPPKTSVAATRMSAFWYELSPASAQFPIIQSGVIDGGPGVHHIYPSIAVNSQNDAVLGFTRTDATRYPEAAYTGRRGNAVPGTMGTTQAYKQGESFYTKFGTTGKKNRWGDYSNSCVDPSDDISLWTIQEYAGTQVSTDSNGGRWATRWAKIDPTTGITEIAADAGVPDHMMLYQNYPNPFNPSTTIQFAVTSAGRASVQVFDLLGREVATLAEGEYAPGTHRVVWEPMGIASGVYLYRLRSGGQVVSKTLVLMK